MNAGCGPQGWELYVPTEFAVAVYDKLFEHDVRPPPHRTGPLLSRSPAANVIRPPRATLIS